MQNFADRLGVAWVESPGTDPFLAPESRLSWSVNGEPVGECGEIDPKLYRAAEIEPRVFFARVSLDRLLPHVTWVRPFEEIAKFPSVKRDLSVTVPEKVKSEEIRGKIRELGQGLVHDVIVFDIFRGGRIAPGFKNLSFRVVYRSSEKTLVSDDVQKLHAGIAAEIVSRFEASFQ
jgi:phenylalanyl-tRNA synthetase beta chain